MCANIVSTVRENIYLRCDIILKIMAFYSPRLQLILVSILCVLIIAGAVVYADTQKNTKTVGTAVILSSENTSGNQILDETGSDSWKDQFINTKNASTTIKSNGSFTEEKQTLTDQLGRNFFVNYIALKQNDLINDEDAVKDVVDNLIYSTALETPTEKIYSIIELKILASKDTSIIRNYGNSVAQIFGTYSPRVDVIDVVKNAFDRNDMGILSQINPIVSGYEKTIAALINTEVPYEFSPYHLNLINGLSRSKYVAEGLRQIETDPTLSLYSLNGYVGSKEEIYNAFIGIKNLLIKSGVAYEPTESGMLFSTII